MTFLTFRTSESIRKAAETSSRRTRDPSTPYREARLNRPSPVKAERKKKILELRSLGETMESIGSQVGLSRTRVSQLLMRYEEER